MFSNKIFSKFIRVEIPYDSTMVIFNSCTDTPQISATPDSRWYLIVLVPFWKTMSFEQMDCVFWYRAAFRLVRVLPQKQCGMLTRHYHSTVARYGLRNDLTFSLNIKTEYTRIPTLKVLTLLICNSG